MPKKNWKIILGIVVGVVLLFGIGNFIQNKFFNGTGNNSIFSSVLPETKKAGAGFFDFSRKKIPVNAKYIDFTFSKDFDEKTVNLENISVSPKLKGKVYLVKTNIIRFEIKDKIEIGQKYNFVLSNKIKTKDGINILETNFDIEVVSPAKVLKINPSGYLNNLNQNFSVFFNVPMVPLTDLDSKDKLPCPIKFSPKVEGKCKWTTSSVLEFIPEKRLFGSTVYEVSVENVDGLLYPLEKPTKVKVYTPKLNFHFPISFSVTKGINFSSNFPVSLDEIKKKLILNQVVCKEKNIEIKKEKTFSSEVKITNNDDYIEDLNLPDIIKEKSGIKSNCKKIENLDFIVTKEKNNFNVKLKNGSFDYNSTYFISFKDDVNSINGNVPFKVKKDNEEKNNNILKGGLKKKIGSYGFFGKYIQSRGFLNSVKVYRNIYSETGALINTKFYDTNNEFGRKKYIPLKDLFLNLEFEEEVPLLKKYFSFESNDGKKVNFDISYIKNKENKIDKKKIKFEIKTRLENNKTYNLIIYKNINSSLKENVIKKFYSAKKLEIKDFEFINYKKSCLYLSNPIENYNNYDKIFKTNPKSRIASIEAYEYIPYELRKELKNIRTYEEQKKFLKRNGYCIKAKTGEYLYVIHTRLNPESKYSLIVKNEFEDIYGAKLEKPFTKNVKTGEIKNEDKYLYLSVSKEINVIPNNLNLIINLQTINLDKIYLEVCEMDEKGYMDYVYNRYKKNYRPKCFVSSKGNIEVKNKFWNLSNNKIDLEEDFLKRKFKTNFILVKGKKINSNNYSFEKIFIRENLAVNLENAGNKKILFITDFKGNQVTNVSFEFFKVDRKTGEVKQVSNIKTKLNQIQKVFEIDSSYADLFDFVVVKRKDNPQNIGILSLRKDWLSNYSFNYISGASSSAKRYLYLYTERPIYKPGDTVYVKGILRDFKPTVGYVKTNIKKAKLELIGPNGEVILANPIEVGENSNFDTKFVLPKEVELGTFRFRFKVAGEKNEIVRNNVYFDIEEYKKPVFKIEIDKTKKDYILGEKLNLKIKPKYYFGGKLINTTGKYRVLSQNYFFDAKDYSDYQFGEGYAYFDCIYWGACSYDDYLVDAGDFKINSNGEYEFNFDFSGKKIKGEKIYKFSFDVKDPDTQKVVSKTISKVLHSTDSYVGIKTKYYNSKQNGIDVKGIVLDFDAKPKAGKKIKIELIKREWKAVKKKGVDGVFYNNYALEKKLESTNFAVSDGKGEFSKKIFPKKSGEYEIKVTYTGKNKQDFVSSTTIYVAGNDYIEWNNGNNDVTQLVGEKVQVKIGDKAEYILKSPVNNGKALIVIEKDNDILDYFVHDIKTYADKITINVKNNYYPNYYLKVFLVGNQPNNPLPIYKRALAVTKVNTYYKKLAIDIKTNKKEYLPGEEVVLDIFVKDYKGNPVSNADLSISMVDESLLALKGNPKKNPYAFFYDLKRYLGVITYSSLKNLIEKLEVKNTKNGEKGGAGDQVKGGDAKKKRGEFRDTAFWKASATTDANGKLHIKTSKLPDNLTTWVIEVLANTPTDTKVGVNYETITTTKKLLINDNLPRFFGSNDEIVLSPVIFNKTGKDDTFNISLKIDNAQVIGDKSKNIEIKKRESKTVNFKVKIKDIGISENKDLFSSKVNFKAISRDRKYVDEIEKFIQIKEVSTPEFVSTTGKTTKTSFEEKINIGEIKNNAGKLTINYSATLLSSILDGIDYLNKYPYGCSEQKTSAIMPNIYIKELYNSFGKDFDLKTKMVKYWAGDLEGYKEKSLDQVIKEYLVSIRKYQNIDGGFTYFYDTDYHPSNFALTSYILESLSEIKKIGYDVDEKILEKASEYLKEEVYKSSRNIFTKGGKSAFIEKEEEIVDYYEIDKLKAISAILSYKKDDYEAYKMYKLLNLSNENNSFKIEQVKVLAKLINIKSLNKIEKNILKGKAKKIINTIINNELVFNPKGAYIGKTSYSTSLINTTSLIEAMSSIGLENFSENSQIIDNINRWIVSQKKNGSFGSTADNISVIKAITKYLEESQELKNVDFLVRLKLNNELIDTKEFDEKNKLEVYSKNLSLEKLKDENSFIIEKDGTGVVYYDLNLKYYKEASQIKARDEGFFVDVKYYDYNEYKKIETLKKDEWKKYLENKITYDDLQYPKEIFEYLKEVKTGKVGQLLIARNKIITTETRDKVAFEGFIPAGSELINPKLATSSKERLSENNLNFSKKEYRNDRIFAYTEKLYPGIYNFTYLIRLTHSGKYSIKPTKISEFYNVEVFGRSSGKIFEIK